MSSNVAFWVLMQAELKCHSCQHFLPHRRGTGPPCRHYYDLETWEGVGECKYHKHVKPADGIEKADIERIPTDD